MILRFIQPLGPEASGDTDTDNMVLLVPMLQRQRKKPLRVENDVALVPRAQAHSTALNCQYFVRIGSNSINDWNSWQHTKVSAVTMSRISHIRNGRGLTSFAFGFSRFWMAESAANSMASIEGSCSLSLRPVSARWFASSDATGEGVEHNGATNESRAERGRSAFVRIL